MDLLFAFLFYLFGTNPSNIGEIFLIVGLLYSLVVLSSEVLLQFLVHVVYSRHLVACEAVLAFTGLLSLRALELNA